MSEVMLSSKTEEKVVRCAMTIVVRYVVSESEDPENFICRWKVNSLEIEDKDGTRNRTREGPDPSYNRVLVINLSTLSADTNANININCLPHILKML